MVASSPTVRFWPEADADDRDEMASSKHLLINLTVNREIEIKRPLWGSQTSCT